ncbi:MAG: ATP-binding protein [Thalassobaculaceae bacterium]
MSDARRIGLTIPVVGLISGLVLAVFAVAWFAAQAQDRQAMDAMRHTVRSVVEANRNELGGWVSDYAYWDSFIENVVLAPDPTWIQGNIGVYAHENLDVDITLVVNGSNEPYVVSVSEDLSLAEPLLELPAAMVALVLAARREAGPVDQRPPPQETFIRLHDRIFIAAAAVAKWEEEAALPTRRGGPVVLVYLREINDERLAVFARDYMVRDLALAGPGAESVGGLALRGLDAQTVAHLVWQNPTPGTEFLRSLSVPMVVIVLIAGASLAWIIGRIRATVGQILTAHEALRIARDEADRANRAKTEFLAQMSHDLRTPLNAILGFSEVIALQTFGSDAAAADRYRDYARQIHRGGDHLRTLIDSILDVARLDAGRYELRPETLSLDAEIATCLSLLGRMLESKSITVHAPSTGLSLTGDQGALEQILLNLVGNAAKYTDVGGTIAIEAQRIHQGTSIVIRDTGRGMSDEDVARAFELFTRGGETLGMAGAEGSGLGLSIVKRLVNLHGGTVRLESRLGTGTTVSVFLPDRDGADPTALGDASDVAA